MLSLLALFSPADVFFGVNYLCFLLWVKHPCFESNIPALSQTPLLW